MGVWVGGTSLNCSYESKYVQENSTSSDINIVLMGDEANMKSNSRPRLFDSHSDVNYVLEFEKSNYLVSLKYENTFLIFLFDSVSS